MRHVRGNAESLTGVDHDFPAIDVKLQRTFEKITQLLICVAVQRDHTALFHLKPRQHHIVTGDELPVQQRIQFFGLDFVPADLPQHFLLAPF